MESMLPAWLNEDFLTLALQGVERSRSKVKISKFVHQSAVAAGNNYTSHVFRVIVEYRNEGSPERRTISLIVKAPVEKTDIGECFDMIGLFIKEPKMYKTVLPVLQEKVGGEFSPKYFHSEGNSLVLEDLKPYGYILGDKFKQLDFKHCRIAINCLGKFHAASVAYHIDHPDFMETVQECFYREESPMAEQCQVLLTSALKRFLKFLDENGYKQMAHYVSQRLDKVWSSVVKLCAPSINSLNVLNHGDCWTNNMLFKYNDSGDIIDVKFIDYQLVRYSSPVSDLLFFIWTSGDEDVRDNNQHELFTIYLQTLNRTLEELNCQERLTHEELDILLELKPTSDWVLLILCYILPTIIFNPDDNLHLEDMQSSLGKENESVAHCNTFYQQLLPGYLRQFERMVFPRCRHI